FSSRRRHTRFSRDWSSDVCSSDLAARPQQTVDPIIVAAQMVTALQTIVSRNLDPLEAAVLSVTMIEAGEADNVISQTAKITGTRSEERRVGKEGESARAAAQVAR